MERWTALCGRLGMSAEGEFQRLWDAYHEPARGYHGWDHIAACLRWMDEAPIESDWLELAFWYHDAVYNPRASDNEARSADWAVATLTAQGLPAEPVRGLIMVTCHSGQPANELEGWMVDIDLAILGADPAAFERYEQGVRKEYSWVPGFLFRKKRKEILQGFLGRPRLYHHDWFFERLEEPARTNLRAAIARL